MSNRTIYKKLGEHESALRSNRSRSKNSQFKSWRSSHRFLGNYMIFFIHTWHRPNQWFMFCTSPVNIEMICRQRNSPKNRASLPKSCTIFWTNRKSRVLGFLIRFQLKILQVTCLKMFLGHCIEWHIRTEITYLLQKKSWKSLLSVVKRGKINLNLLCLSDESYCSVKWNLTTNMSELDNTLLKFPLKKGNFEGFLQPSKAKQIGL